MLYSIQFRLACINWRDECVSCTLTLLLDVLRHPHTVMAGQEQAETFDLGGSSYTSSLHQSAMGEVMR